MTSIAPQQYMNTAAPIGSFVPSSAPQFVQQPVASAAPAVESAEDDPKLALKTHMKFLKEAAKSLFRAQYKLSQAEAQNRKLLGPDGVNAFTKTELNAYRKQYSSEMTKLGKLVTAALKGKKRSGAGNGHLSAPFYVSRQIPEFFSKVNLGYGGTDANGRVEALFAQVRAQQGDAAAEQACIQFMRTDQPAGQNRVQDQIAFLTRGLFPGDQSGRQGFPDFFEKGLASAQMLISLFRLYFTAHGLQSKSNGSYFNLNEEFLRSFGHGTNTHLILDGRDLSVEHANHFANREFASLSDEEKKLAEKLDARTANQSVVERLAYLASLPSEKVKKITDTTSKKETKSFIAREHAGGTDAWGVAGIAGISRFVNFFRIPKELLSEQQKGLLLLAPAKEDTDADRRSYAQRKTDMVITYLSGRKSDDPKEAKKATKSQKGLIDAHRYATHLSDDVNTKDKRTKKNREKTEKNRHDAALAQATSSVYPTISQVDPSLIPTNMFSNMQQQAHAPTQ